MATNTQKIGISLAFSADVTKAKGQLRDLKKSIDELIADNSFGKNLDISPGLAKSNKELQQLSTTLRLATTESGKLDISKFNNSLKSSGKSLSQYADTLLSLGPKGEAAFNSLSTSIMNAEVPIKKTNKLVAGLYDNLKKTIGWQFSSSAIHMFMGSIQRAYGYAQDLNESLNKIRIVTGQSTDQMAKFAKQANTAAKELKTTTTAYTDAALIFYQQGLTGDDVKERTDAVIKMSNVTGQSASEVSSYMTAIWNNFDDGSQSLEHYADVITALGAATASSSEEIAEGLEKFAAIGNTVGLSYEYATTALATVVAQTRQSADTVGTAFKTLFARIQDLELGKTLDDGTTLGKYSQALQTIGVNIKDASGQAKDMDQILDEMGSKWQTIDKNTQIAVAQAVAGTRQYSQLVALMDNWDKFQDNLTTANNSRGALQRQADIYAESWEGARKELRASLEGLYDDLLNDDFFIKLTKLISDLVKGIDSFMKTIGGLPGILANVFAIVTKIKKEDMSNSIARGIDNISFKASALKQSFQERKDGDTSHGSTLKERYAFNSNRELVQKEEAMNTMKSKLALGPSRYGEEQLNLNNKIFEKQLDFIKNQSKMTDSEKLYYQILLDELQTRKQIVEQADKEYNEIEEKRLKTREKLKISDKPQWEEVETVEEDGKKYTEYKQGKSEVDKLNEAIDENSDTFKKLSNTERKAIEEQVTILTDNNERIKKLAGIAVSEQRRIDKVKNFSGTFKQGIENLGKDPSNKQALIKQMRIYANNQEFQEGLNGDQKTKLEELMNTLEDKTSTIEQINNAFKNFSDTGNEVNHTAELIKNTFGEQSDIYKTIATELGLTTEQEEKFNQVMQQTVLSADDARNKLDQNKDKYAEWGKKAASAINSLASAGATISNFSNMVQNFGKDTASTITSISMGLSSFASIAIKFASGDIIGGVVQAVGAATGAIVGFFQRRNKEILESAQLEAETTRKNMDHYNELADGMKKVGTQYDQLMVQLKEGAISDAELRSEISNLCTEYDNESLAILALTGSYDQLNTAIRQSIEERNNAAKASSETAVKYAKKGLKEALSQSDVGFGNSIKTNFGNELSREEIQLRDRLKSFNIKFDENNNIISDTLIDALAENYDEVIEVFQNGALNNIGKSDDILKTLNNLGSEIDNVVATNSSYQKAGLTTLTNNIDTKDINSYSQYLSKVNEAAKKAVQEHIYSSETEAIEKINTELAKSGDKAIAQYAARVINANNLVKATYGQESDYNKHLDAIKANKAYEEEDYEKLFYDDQGYTRKEFENYINLDSYKQLIAETLNKDQNAFLATSGSEVWTKYNNQEDVIKKTIEGYREYLNALEKEGTDNYSSFTENFQKQLADFSQGEQEWFVQHTELVKAYKGNLQLIAKEYPEALKYASEKAAGEYAEGIASSIATRGSKATKDELNALYNNGPLEVREGRSISKENFDEIDYASQSIALMQYANQKRGFIEQNRDLAVEAAKAERDAYIEANKEELKDWNGTINKRKTDVDKLLKDTEKEFSEVDLNKLIEEYKDDNQYNINSNEQFKKLVKNAFNGDAAAANEYLRAQKNAKNYEETLSKLVNNISEASKETFKYTTFSEDARKANEAASKQLDNIQSSYKTLTSAIEEYNSNGGFSIDTLQSLLQLGPEYLDCLEDTGNGYQLNTQKLVDMTKAQLYNMEVSEAADALSLIHQIKDNQLNETDKARIQTLSGLTTATEDYAQALMKEAAAVMNGLDGEKLKLAQDAYNLAEKKIKMLSNTAAKTTGATLGQTLTGIKNALKLYSEEFDRYYEVNQAIKEIERSLSRLKEEQNHVFGEELINNLDKVNKKLAEQKATYEELYRMQKEESAEVKSRLETQGVKFDTETGEITNYDEITHQKFASQGKDDKNYENFKKDLARYLELQDAAEDTQDKIDGFLREMRANNLKKWETDIQIKIDDAQAKRDLSKFNHDLNEDFKNIYKDYDKEIQYHTEQLDTYQDSIAAKLGKVNNINFELNELREGRGSAMFNSASEAEEALKKATKELQDEQLAYKSELVDTWETYLSSIDQAKDKLSKMNEEYDRMNDELEHQSRLMELIYGPDAYNEMLPIYQTQVDVSLSRLGILKGEADEWLDLYNKAVEQNGENSEDAMKYLENYREATSALHSEEEAYLEKIQQLYKATISSIIDEAKKAATGGVNLDWAKTQWDDTQRKNEGIFDGVEKVYQLNSLQSKWNDLISDTTGLKNQQKLRDVMAKQFEYLEGKTELTEYDIGLAEKELEVEKARIALEEAQNAKNSMKLVRNAEGNWSYQYVADEDDVSKKQQDYMNKLNDRYEYVKKANADALEAILDLESEYWDRYQEIMEDTSLSEEERFNKTEYLYNLYYGDNGLLTQKYRLANLTEQQLNKATYDSLSEYYTANENSYNNMTEKEKEFITGLKNHIYKTEEEILAKCQEINSDNQDNWQSTAKNMADAWDGNEDSIKVRVTKAMEKCDSAWRAYCKSIEEGSAKAGEDLKTPQKAIEEIGKKIGEVETATTKLIQDTTKQLETYGQNIGTLEGIWQKVKLKVEENESAMISYGAAIETAIANYNLLAEAKKNFENGSSNSGGQEVPTDPLKDSKKAYYNYRSIQNGDGEYDIDVNFVMDGILRNLTLEGDSVNRDDINGSVQEALKKLGATDIIQKDSLNAYQTETFKWDKHITDYSTGDIEYDIIDRNNKTVASGSSEFDAKNSFKKKFGFLPVGLSTGGYTGEWDSSGRLAILHEKELVLNQEDTKNMLNAVEAVRGITSSIGSSLLSQLAGWASSLSGISPAAIGGSNTVDNSSANNVFNITAEFPNANDVDEIREAILSLPNLASQYMNVKTV